MAPFLRMPVLTAATLLALSGARAAPTETIIFNFHLRDGIGEPAGPLTMSPDGSLYGVTSSGGGSTVCKNGCGTIYKLTPPKSGATIWTGTILYAFSDSYSYFVDGRLALGADGSLYGARQSGPGTDPGSIFKLTPPTGGGTPWTYESIYHFTGGAEYYSANGGVVIDASGALYGVTLKGGSSDYGTVFKLSPPGPSQTEWTETIIYSFEGPLQLPFGPLKRDADGGLYATAFSYDNRADDVTIFSINPTVGSKPRILYTFDRSGRYDPNLNFIVGQGGAIFGAADVGGGCSTRKPMTCGAVYELAPTSPRTASYLHIFGNRLGGETPNSLIAGPNGSLYGTTRFGGLGADQGDGHGIVYKLTPPASGGAVWTKTFVHEFRGSPDGQEPFSLIEDTAGVLYGVTRLGGSLGRGVVFKIVP